MLLKSIFARPRPSNIYLVKVSGYSFPSGHAMTSAAFYGFIIYLIWQTNIRKNLKIASTVFLFILIILIGVSRVYLGVHYTSDIAAGFLVSIAYLIVFTKLTSIYLKGDDKKMYPKLQNNNHKSLISSFRCAFNGIKISFESGRNIIVHYIIALIVILLGIFLKISSKEWVICVMLFGLVISAEMINTAVETIVDLITQDINPLAKRAKDISAGAVLVLAIAAAVVGLIIFIPKIYNLIF
ncbi:MAG: phosphatase PAP2 family protein [Eubacteriaceae bacterium]|nr:phosphatase PAP2 family protein [Eubacteriaceae bacterium]